MKHFLILFLFLAVNARVSGQSTDSMLIISPGLSPSVVPQGHFEIALFNQLSTLTFEQTFGLKTDTYRYSDLYHVLQVGYGVDKYNRLNVGVSGIFAHNRQDVLENRGIFSVFKGQDDSSRVYRKMAAVGVFARAIPFRRLPELTIQAGVFFPTVKDFLAQQYSGYDRTQGQLQISFYQQFSPIFYAFASASANVFFPNDNRKQTTLSVPVGLYPVVRMGYYSKTYLFGSLVYDGSFNKVTPGFLNNTFTRMQYGLGVQYYFKPDFSIYLQLQFPAVVDYKSDATKVVKGKTFSLALGGRYVI